MKHLTQEQRCKIVAYLKAGYSKPDIAILLGVHKCNVYREIERNGYGRYRTYKPKEAQKRAEYRWGTENFQENSKMECWS